MSLRINFPALFLQSCFEGFVSCLRLMTDDCVVGYTKTTRRDGEGER
jgi:hypothetical protein